MVQIQAAYILEVDDPALLAEGARWLCCAPSIGLRQTSKRVAMDSGALFYAEGENEGATFYYADQADREIRERVLRQLLKLQLAHDESLKKSELARQAWRLRRTRARQTDRSP